MKRLPRARIHSYYNPMDKTALNSAQMCITPAVLDNAIATYGIVDSFSAFSASWGSWSGGIEYSQKRLADPLDVPTDDNGAAIYSASNLFRLQNPGYDAPIEERPVLIREIVKNYLQYPKYNVFNTDISALEELSAFVGGFDTEDFSATTPTVFKGNINVNLCKCKEDCECKQKDSQPPKQETTPQTNACNCLEEFEREYQEFIEMLRRNRKKLPDTEELYLSAWEESGCNCEQI